MPTAKAAVAAPRRPERRDIHAEEVVACGKLVVASGKLVGAHVLLYQDMHASYESPEDSSAERAGRRGVAGPGTITASAKISSGSRLTE